MSREQHRADAGDSPIAVHILVVSSTRSAATDESGVLIAELVEAAGQSVASRAVVDDDIDAIRAAVRERAEQGAQVVVLTGGTGITGRDLTPEALEPILRPRMDGFGELFRMLSWDEIGAAAMMSRAIAGLVRRTVVFAIPGSRAACRLAVEKLILPELSHLVHLASQDRPSANLPILDEPESVDVAFEPAPESPAQPGADTVPVWQPAAVAMSSTGSESAPPQETEAAWQGLIRKWGGSVSIEAREPLPESLEKVSPVLDVLQQAGRAASLVLGDGRRFSLWGFPDLLRPSSKVIVIREGGELGEVLALHRWPSETGTVVAGGVLDHLASDPMGAAERITGRRPPRPMGPLFAVNAGSTFHLAGSKVVQWDGHREREEGSPKQVLASLVLDWSVR